MKKLDSYAIVDVINDLNFTHDSNQKLITHEIVMKSIRSEFNGQLITENKGGNEVAILSIEKAFLIMCIHSRYFRGELLHLALKQSPGLLDLK